MSDYAFDFLQSWIVDNAKLPMHEHKDKAEHLTQDCVWEAQTRGITKADLIEAAGGNLDTYILVGFNRAVDRQIEDSIPQRVS